MAGPKKRPVTRRQFARALTLVKTGPSPLRFPVDREYGGRNEPFPKPEPIGMGAHFLPSHVERQ
jgi:hypothetical protein